MGFAAVRKLRRQPVSKECSNSMLNCMNKDYKTNLEEFLVNEYANFFIKECCSLNRLLHKFPTPEFRKVE